MNAHNWHQNKTIESSREPGRRGSESQVDAKLAERKNFCLFTIVDVEKSCDIKGTEW